MVIALDQAAGNRPIGIISKMTNMAEYSLPVENNLIDRAESGDIEALFQLGIYALSAKRYGYAKAIFQKAVEKNHPQAKRYLEITLAKIKEM